MPERGPVSSVLPSEQKAVTPAVSSVAQRMDMPFPRVRVEWKKGDPRKKGAVSHTVGRIGAFLPDAILLGTPKAAFQNPRPDLEEYLRSKWDGTYLGSDPVIYANHSPLLKQLGRLFSSDRRMNPVQRVLLGFPGTIIAQTAALSRGDHYNPYTEATVLWHPSTAVAMHETGHKEDFANKRFPGLRALAYGLPVVTSAYEWFASRNAMAHLHTKEEREQAKKILEPAWGTYVGTDVVKVSGILFPFGMVKRVLQYASLAPVAGAIAGHIHARTSSKNLFYKENGGDSIKTSEKASA